MTLRRWGPTGSSLLSKENSGKPLLRAVPRAKPEEGLGLQVVKEGNYASSCTATTLEGRKGEETVVKILRSKCLAIAIGLHHLFLKP